jgi:hypothetical protein
MKSKITGGDVEVCFTGKVLNKYDVTYYRCLDTGFIQTEEPYWLTEAYSSAITKLDIGLVGRNEIMREKLAPILSNFFNATGKFLDYAGGYGLFTRMMRDRGYDFYHTDIYCQNLFAEYFDLIDVPAETKFELITAFEVFEHLPNPLAELEQMAKYADSIFFSTMLQPKIELKSFEDWWYFIPETGQHVALYTEKSLAFLAQKFGYHFYTDGIGIHLFTKKQLPRNPFAVQKLPYLMATMKRKVDRYFRKLDLPRESLLQKDFELIKSKINP